jgi:hypothetical protein
VDDQSQVGRWIGWRLEHVSRLAGACEAGRQRVQFAVYLANDMGARLSGLHVTLPAEVPPRCEPSLVAEVAADSLRSWPWTPAHLR